jgi:hypothetical protein
MMVLTSIASFIGDRTEAPVVRNLTGKTSPCLAHVARPELYDDYSYVFRRMRGETWQ